MAAHSTYDPPEPELTEGNEVCVVDDSGHKHFGLISSIEVSAGPLYTVLLTCRGQYQELVVPETRILARVSSRYDF